MLNCCNYETTGEGRMVGNSIIQEDMLKEKLQKENLLIFG